MCLLQQFQPLQLQLQQVLLLSHLLNLIFPKIVHIFKTLSGLDIDVLAELDLPVKMESVLLLILLQKLMPSDLQNLSTKFQNSTQKLNADYRTKCCQAKNVSVKKDIIDQIKIHVIKLSLAQIIVFSYKENVFVFLDIQ